VGEFDRRIKRAIQALLPFRVSIRIRRKRRIPRTYRESDANVRSDVYIAWLCRVNGGWLDAGSGNLRAMDHAVRHMPDGGSVVEIGSFLGVSLNALTYLMLKYERPHRVFSCDPWDFEDTEKPIGGFFDAGSDSYRDYAREVFKRNVQLFSAVKPPYPIEAYSHDFFLDWSKGICRTDVFGREVELGGPISFAYIDGAHTYEASMGDFRNIDEHLVSGGFVLFDDSSDRGPFESTRAAQEAASLTNYELVFKAPNYLLRKR
jgi:hypothetical protein